jgi:hypothetical protein
MATPLLVCCINLVEVTRKMSGIENCNNKNFEKQQHSLSYDLLEITEGIMGAVLQRVLILRHCHT